MMKPNLWGLILASSFGGSSKRPIRAAYSKLLIIGCGSLILGVLGSKALSKLILPTDIPLIWLSGLIALVCYVLFGLVGLSLSTLTQRLTGQPPLSIQSRVWPLSKKQMWQIEY